MNSILRKLKLKQDTEFTDDKATLMIRNGATILKELIASSHRKYNPYRIFSSKELKLATNNFDEQKVIINNGWYKLYKGYWQERLISVMKFGQKFYDGSINNIVYASQMSHKHILKLIGCCLETQIPILVFEPVEYGTLTERLRIDRTRQRQFEPLLMTHRLKIGMDIANAIAYFHLGFPRPIIFRGFNTSRILFNEENDAKLFDFSLSISIPQGETHVTDAVRGTFVIIAPEYLNTGNFNEKIDVFSFGLFLSELLTGQRVFELCCLEKQEGVVFLNRMKKLFEENKFNEIIDPLIMEDNSFHGKEEQLQALTQLIFECVNASPVDRPTMVDVAKKLRQMYRACFGM